MFRALTLAAIAFSTLLAGPLLSSADAAAAQLTGRRLTVGGTDIGESFYIREVIVRGIYTREWGYLDYARLIRVHIVDRSNGSTLLLKYFLKDDISTIGVFGQGGNDNIEVNTDIDCGLFGGWGDDDITGGSGDDYIDAGPGGLDIVDGREGDDVLYSGQKPYFGPFVSSPYTEMRGGEGRDTFIYRNSDYLHMDNFSGSGWMIAPDYTFGTSHDDYPGMHLIVE